METVYIIFLAVLAVVAFILTALGIWHSSEQKQKIENREAAKLADRCRRESAQRIAHAQVQLEKAVVEYERAMQIFDMRRKAKAGVRYGKHWRMGFKRVPLWFDEDFERSNK